jgi:hypothetical protein
MEKHRFNLHLSGLLKVLAEHLYSTKKLGVRELIQNAHDSCVRRKIEEGRGDYQPRIDLAIDSGVEKGTGIITGRAWIRPRLHAPRKDPRPNTVRPDSCEGGILAACRRVIPVTWPRTSGRRERRGSPTLAVGRFRIDG